MSNKTKKNTTPQPLYNTVRYNLNKFQHDLRIGQVFCNIHQEKQ